MMGDRRCPTCGALASADADWCGRGFAPLSPPPKRRGPRPDPASPATSAPTGTAGPKAIRGPSGGAIEVEGGTLAWTCPVCENRNPIEANQCSTCGTPFGRLVAGPKAATGGEAQAAA